MSEKLTAKERYEADKARLAAKREANNAELAARKAANDARLHNDLERIREKNAATDAKFHDDIAASKAELKKTWSDYGADRRARKEAKQAAKASKRA